MGLFDLLSGTKKPAAGTPVLGAEEVRTRILAVGRPTAPFQIVDGAAEQVDLIAQWKIVDAKWFEIFAKAGLSKSFRIFMKLDSAAHEVRAVDREYTVAWSAGVPKMTLAASAFRGQSQQIEFGKAYGFTEKLETGQIYNYKFDTSEMKKPLQAAIASCGWTYKGVAFGKL
jgi:outer membrane protein TolC